MAATNSCAKVSGAKTTRNPPVVRRTGTQNAKHPSVLGNPFLCNGAQLSFFGPSRAHSPLVNLYGTDESSSCCTCAQQMFWKIDSVPHCGRVNSVQWGVVAETVLSEVRTYWILRLSSHGAEVLVLRLNFRVAISPGPHALMVPSRRKAGDQICVLVVIDQRCSDPADDLSGRTRRRVQSDPPVLTPPW